MNGGRQARRWLPLGSMLAVVVVAAVALGPGGGGGAPLDPRSNGRRGTRALVLLLRRLGARVDVGRPGGDRPPVALVLHDDLDPRQRAVLQRWTRAGTVLVLTDADSPLNPFEPVGTTGVGVASGDMAGRCPLIAVRDVHRVSAPDSAVLRPGARGTGCFARDGGDWLVTRPEGRGHVVVLGGPWAFTNERLGRADNAVLAAALLAPAAGGVLVVQPPPPGGGRRSLADLVAPRVKAALWQLGVAFGLLALWRGRRLGRPVLEPQPVQLAGSELVVATGNLLHRAGARAQAASVLRSDLHRRLTDGLGLPLWAGDDEVADAASARAGVPRERVLAALSGPPPAGESELVALAQLVESVGLEVARG